MDVYASVTQKQLGKKKRFGKEGSDSKNGKNDAKNKKIVHDLFVQGTNDSSIVSKRSVEILYTDKVEENAKKYFQHFVKKSPRRTPVINRGYWIRMKSIRMAIERIIEQQPVEQRINIINLGCGYDPLPFQLLDDLKFTDKKLYCIDVDFPELISYKSQMIHMAPELMELIGELKEPHVDGINIRTDRYSTMGCDLTDKELFCRQLESFNANSDSTTNIFIAEVSLAYMTPETANPIIQTSSEFSNSHFLILEQLMPSGGNHPFAKRMINHFKKMEAPLQCVHTYPTINDQIKRFQDLGYKSVNARDLLGCWELVPSDIKLKVAQVEPFDEWEEFIFFAQHYINLHATNQPNVVAYDKAYTELYPPLPSGKNNYKLEIQETLPMDKQRKFHSCLNFENASFMTCGINQSRLSDTVQLLLSADNKAEVITPTEFKPRVGAVSVGTNSGVYLIGGRKIPGMGIDEVWKLSQLDQRKYQWIKCKPTPLGRVKHTSICINGEDILVVGGSSGEGFVYYSKTDDQWVDLKCSNDENFHGFESCALVEVDKTIYILGGMIFDPNGGFKFNSKIYQVELHLQSKVVELKEVLNHKTLARYGFKTIVHNSKILIVGGVGKKLYDQYDTIVEVDLNAGLVVGIKIDDIVWTQNPVFIGSDVIERNGQSWIIGGGAVCYGFGSVWGNVVNFNFGNNPSKTFRLC